MHDRRMTDEDSTRRDSEMPTAVETPKRSGAAERASLHERYQVTEQLGEGGMGEVLAARDEVLGREVAIKRMTEVSPSAAQTSRFLREARIQGTLDHPAIPPVHELAYDPEGRPYFVMKRLQGTTLSKILGEQSKGTESTKFSRERLLRAFADVCLAVELAHTRGIVHRDLKPANIMLGDFGEVYVLDWGVAKVLGDFDPTLAEVRARTPSAEGTAQGSVIGTPGYMSPEQRTPGGEIDGRADVYALGCVLFEILAGKRLKLATPARPSTVSPERQIPPELDELVAQATEPDVERRLATARVLGERVQRFLDGDRDLALRRKLATEHLERATAAMGRDDQESHRTTIREGGRALALDPTLPGAAELIGRIMLEPPRTTPPEVEAEIAAANVIASKKHARIAGVSYIAYAVFVPVMVWIGIKDPTLVIPFATLAAVMGGISVRGARHGHSRTLVAIALIGNACLIALIARMFTPFLIAPGLAALTIVIQIGNPSFRSGHRWLGVIAAMLVAVMVPWILELAGVLGATTSFTDSYIVLSSGTIDVDAVPIQVALTIYVIVLLLFATVVRRAMAHVEERSQRRLITHAWQLRQLVPAS